MKKRLALNAARLLLPCLALAGTAQALTHTVTSDADSGAGSLREQITLANGNAGPDVVVFSGPMCITVTSGVISVTDGLLLDGGGQVVLSGNSSGSILRLVGASQGSTVTGLAFVLASAYEAMGLQVSSSCNRIYGCRFGTDWQDNSGLGNYYAMTLGGYFNDVGGSTPAERNVFCGNPIGLQTLFAAYCTVRGNYFGIQSTGDSVLSNTIGIDVDYGTCATRFGGDRLAGEANVIGGNSGRGLYMDKNAMGNTLCGNIVGMLPSLAATAANSTGIEIYGAKGNYVGLTPTGYENIVAGNSSNGIVLNGNYQTEPTPRWNVVQHNYVGILPDDTPRPNQASGISMYHACNNLIGGNRLAGEGNIISGNAGNGISMEDGYGNTFAGNYIGTVTDGSGAAPNGHGIHLAGGHNNLVGGPNLGGQWLGNLISGNNGYGVVMNKSFFASPLIDNLFQGNWIGLNAGGVSALPNGYSGLYGNDCSRTVVGGSDVSIRNVIAGNTQYGIVLTGGTGNQITGNYLGTNVNGTGLVTNQLSAVYLSGASFTTIGGTTPAANVICGGTGGELSGIYVSNSGNNTCAANFIGVLATGEPTSPTFTHAVFLTNTARDNLIGQAGGLGNLLAGAVNGITLGNGTCLRNGFWSNTICAFSGQGIQLLGSANEGKAAPAIQSADLSLVQGNADANDQIQVFVSDRGAGLAGGSLRLVGEGNADGSGNWSAVCTGLQYGQYVCALATNAAGSTSAFSLNVLVSPPPSPTPSATATNTATPTPSSSATATPSCTPTSTSSPTCTVSATATPSGTLPPTATSTATPTATATLLPTGTPTPVFTRSFTPTPSMSPTATVTATSAADGLLAAWTGKVFPNPARGHIQFVLPPAQSWEIGIYNLYGERIAVIRETADASSSRTITWNCQDIAPGIYLADLKADGKSVKRAKFALVK
ncbi:MAG: T9SS type A sorting domain-containing protein [candidate division FCPU426 bacterium]